MLAWYIAITEPNHEAIAAEAIEADLKFPVFNPQMRQRIIRRNAGAEILRPVFPGYLMVQFDPADEAYPWQDIYRAEGIRRRNGQAFLTGAGSKPVPIADIAVTTLMAICSEVETTKGLRVRVMEDVEAAMRTLLRVGHRVRVLTGPFADQVGEVVWTVGERARVLLAFMGGVPVEIRADRLEVVA